MDIRLYAAIIAGKTTASLARLLGGGGGALPGLVAEKIDPHILTKLSARCSRGIVLVSGTNGKTTTCRLIGAALTRQFGSCVHNRSGSNLLRGHIAAFLEDATWGGNLRSTVALLETDEAVLPLLLRSVQPTTILLTNLFRDQLDRYGEVNAVAARWQTALSSLLPPTCTLALNADDPTLAFMGLKLAHPQTLYYGLDDPSQAQSTSTSTIDTYLSPDSGKPLQYSAYYLSHLGEYQDTASSFKRPPLAIAAKKITLGTGGSTISMGHGPTLTLPLPGLYNAYNAVSAYVACQTLSVDTLVIEESFSSIQGVFGRFEELTVGDKKVILCLIKNPVGATEVIRTILADPSPYGLAFLSNDNFADGQDVSWYWDVDAELLDGHKGPLLCGGGRAYDMALRLKYAGVSSSAVIKQPIPEAIATLLEFPNPTIYLLSTYTATLEVQKELSRRGIKQPYWQE